MFYDPRYDKLAGVLTQQSTAVQPGEKVLIEVTDVPEEMTIALTRAVQKAEGTASRHGKAEPCSA